MKKIILPVLFLSVTFFLHKGIITDKIKDTILLLSFNNDTLLFHKIIAIDKQYLKLKSTKDSSLISFKKEQ